MVVATLGVAGDAVWHTEFGVEVGITRLISPFHLILFAGAFMVVGAALRSGWHSERPARGISMSRFFPVLLSVTLMTAMTSYFFQELSPLVTWIPPGLVKLSATSPFQETTNIYMISSVLITNLIFLGPVLLMLRRWQPPFGSVTFLFGAVALLDASQTELSRGAVVGAAIVGGLVADLVIRRVNPSPTNVRGNRIVATVTPLAFWTGHFGVMWIAYEQSWVPELWAGAIVLAAMSGYVLSLLMNPSPVSQALWEAREESYEDDDYDYEDLYEDDLYEDDTHEDDTHEDGVYEYEDHVHAAAVHGDHAYAGDTYEDELYEDELYEDELYEDELYEGDTYEGDTYEDDVYEDDVYEDDRVAMWEPEPVRARRPSVARQATAKQATARQASARQGTARQATRQATARQATARQATTRHPNGRQPTTRQPSVRQPTARRVAVMQDTVRQPTGRKSAVRQRVVPEAVPVRRPRPRTAAGVAQRSPRQRQLRATTPSPRQRRAAA
jgi:hypothetical protein